MKHVIDTDQFDRKTVEALFTLADSLSGVRNDSLKGKILATLFYEPSTRTRFSFESAMSRLGGTVISTENAKEFSSAAKGETLEDTIRVMNSYADVLVLRHPEAGAAERAARVSSIPVINAGDGAGHHPTQALLDVYTIQKSLGNVDGITVALVGDLKNGRAARSLVSLLTQFDDISFTFVSPPELKMGSDITDLLTKRGVAFTETDDLSRGTRDADVVYMTRVQKERFPDTASYERLKGKYVLTRDMADALKETAIIMHPLPRVDELLPEVDASPKAVYFKQASYGVTVRMALLTHLLS